MAERLLETSAETMSPGIIQGQDDAAEEVHAFMGSLRPFWGRALLYIVSAICGDCHYLGVVGQGGCGGFRTFSVGAPGTGEDDAGAARR